MVSVLTAGCLLGALALLGISLAKSYVASAWTPYVLAHANSQLYGWVGFFIMGFALQHHPPTVAKQALFHKLAYWAMGLMGGGIALRFAAEPAIHVDHALWLNVGVFSCVMQTAAVLLFIANIGLTRFKVGAGTWQTKFVYVSLAWLVVVAVAEPFFFAFSHQAETDRNIQFVAQYFMPYRDAQFLGFAGLMIFGVALTKLNSCFGAQEARRDLGNTGFWLWNLGLALRMGGWLVYYNAGFAAGSEWALHAGTYLLGAGAVALALNTRVFEKLDMRLRSHKFIRASFVWLIGAAVLMILEPLHLAAIGAPFSHAFTGAIRHAVTVGFISQMIIGFSTHVAVMMNDLNPAAQNRLWTAFWLLNCGNAARVAAEIATDYTPTAFGLMGITGFIELTGITLWAANLAGIFLATRRIAVAR